MNNTNQSIHKAITLFATKKMIALALMTFFYLQMWATEPFSPGTELYVTAQSGLHLRALPDARANSIKVIALGEKVTILEETDSLSSQRFDWVDGNWVKILHEGEEGYIFDGYLSPLPTPTYLWERCQLDLDFIHPLEQWSEHNHFLDKTDTVEGNYNVKVIDRYTNGDLLKKVNAGNIYQVELILKDIRIMDAYHLLQSMVDNKPALETFKRQTVYIEEKDSSDLKRIKIKIDNPVDIRKLSDGRVRISIHSQEYPCQL